MIEAIFDRTTFEYLRPLFTIWRCVDGAELGFDLVTIALGVDAANGNEETFRRGE